MNYEVIYPQGSLERKPVLIHIPHSSTYIPQEYRDQICLDDADLSGELLAMTDRFTDQLFEQARSYGVTLFLNKVSRLVMDPERFPDDQDEPMAAKGMGAVYVSTSDGRRLRPKSFSARDRQDVMHDLYWPYSTALQNVVAAQLDLFGMCLVIDAHSFPSQVLPYEDENLVRPDICFGYDVFHEPEKLIDILQIVCKQEGLTIAHNQPFSGSYVPAYYYRQDRRVKSLMIEVNRSLYMDETAGTHSAGYGRFAQVLKRLMQPVGLYKNQG
jgi:N-formylglutamate amidohydrolase